MRRKQFALPKKLHFLKGKRVLFLLILVFLASVTLILINFYTIRTTSAVRSYINGESEYSKGQKDALLYLSTYIQTQDEQYWDAYRASIDVPMGDNIARRALVENGPIETVRDGFLRGKNNPDDLDKMIWLFRNFSSVSFMKKAIEIWADAEPLINQLYNIGTEIHEKINTRTLTQQRKQEVIAKINYITSKLTIQERAFSTVLNAAGRSIDEYLFFANMFFTVLITVSLTGYVMVIIKKLQASKHELKINNEELTGMNRDLDSFVYSTSHDLRAPVTSLKGLIEIVIHENTNTNSEKYLRLMNTVIDKMNTFISEILDFSRNKRVAETIEPFSLKNLVDESIAQNRYMPGAKNIAIEKDIQTDIIYGDAVRMKIIINNLVSNAIKYMDETKENKEIRISAHENDGYCIIQVADNGIGISKEHHERIFEMFFVIQGDQKGSGLGLYITKETVKKLNGTIEVRSEKNAGTSFVIKIPNHYEEQTKVSVG